MATNEDAKRTTRRKLTLSKETIRDLTPAKDRADAVRGGMIKLSRVRQEQCDPSGNMQTC